MIFSKEQEDIFEYAQKGPFNMVIQAVAGAGKTTTLIECANRIDSDKRILMLAHNRSTRDTLKERIGNKPNVRIFTLHGLAYRMFSEHFEKEPKINEEKYREYINKNLSDIAGFKFESLSHQKKMMYKANVFDILDKARYNLKQSEKEIKKLAEKKYGYTLVSNEAETVSKILKWGAENLDVVDFQDLLWLPSQIGYYTKKYVADVIMLDEAQDASLAQQDIVKRCFMRQTRLMAFGDRDQTINNWCGSDIESFEHLHDSNEFRRPAVDFPLTTNYRCGKNIIEYAKQFTDNPIKARNDAEDGVVRHEASLNDVANGDMILCRNVAPLMAVYRIGISLGKKMYFRGESLGKNLIEQVDCATGDKIEDIIKSLKRRLIATWEFLTINSDLGEKETMTDPKVVSLLDTIQTLENLPRTVETRHDLEKFSRDVFSEEGKEGIELSTIHRAKGLEADNVFIICPSLIPSRLATLDWQQKEERHLQYVMCTRPKHSLNFITEKEVRPYSAFSDSIALYSELKKIKEEVIEER